MNLRFSLRDLLVLVALISVACAALANPGIWWHSIVVSATLSTLTAILLWGVMKTGLSRAYAAGWLLFACGYLGLVFGPWTSSYLGPNLISSKALSRLEAAYRGDSVSPLVLAEPTAWDGVDINTIYLSGYNISNVSGRITTSGWPYSPQAGAASDRPLNCTTFQSTGHWLLASLAGFVGAHIAVALRRKESSPSQSAGTC